jgi:hypothetical protein
MKERRMKKTTIFRSLVASLKINIALSNLARCKLFQTKRPMIFTCEWLLRASQGRASLRKTGQRMRLSFLGGQ